MREAIQGKDGAQLNLYTKPELYLVMLEVTLQLEQSGENITRQTAMLEAFVRRTWQDSQWNNPRRQPSRN